MDIQKVPKTKDSGTTNLQWALPSKRLMRWQQCTGTRDSRVQNVASIRTLLLSVSQKTHLATRFFFFF